MPRELNPQKVENTFLLGFTMRQIAYVNGVPVQVVEEAIRQAKRDRDSATKEPTDA